MVGYNKPDGNSDFCNGGMCYKHFFSEPPPSLQGSGQVGINRCSFPQRACPGGSGAVTTNDDDLPVVTCPSNCPKNALKSDGTPGCDDDGPYQCPEGQFTMVTSSGAHTCATPLDHPTDNCDGTKINTNAGLVCSPSSDDYPRQTDIPGQCRGGKPLDMSSGAITCSDPDDVDGDGVKDSEQPKTDKSPAKTCSVGTLNPVTNKCDLLVDDDTNCVWSADKKVCVDDINNQNCIWNEHKTKMICSDDESKLPHNCVYDDTGKRVCEDDDNNQPPDDDDNNQPPDDDDDDNNQPPDDDDNQTGAGECDPTSKSYMSCINPTPELAERTEFAGFDDTKRNSMISELQSEFDSQLASKTSLLKQKLSVTFGNQSPTLPSFSFDFKSSSFTVDLNKWADTLRPLGLVFVALSSILALYIILAPRK